MRIGVVVAVGVVCWVLFRADQDSKKHRAEMLAVRTYENERNFRLQLSDARDQANRENNPESFEEAFSHLGYSSEELHRLADQGSIEAAGNWPSFDLVQQSDAIEKMKAHRLRRAEGLRRDAQKIAKLEGQLAAITEYEAQRKMRCLMSIDRDEADLANDTDLFEGYWSDSGYPPATLHRLADQGYLEIHGAWPRFDFELDTAQQALVREGMEKRAALLRNGRMVRTPMSVAGRFYEPSRYRFTEAD
ncbi:hypothetical protein [Paraburkholderia sp. RL17-347-BIC-D]|uniref:hypothetical protein n=1 Tax=Paraburkholderia sp. RL17-347-BIC-D TaxID=3031632 RepID=UPI0038BAEB45